MPTICMFYGIIIRMYFVDHQPPHFHAVYQDHEAVFDLYGEVLKGNMPRKQIKLIAAWTEIHREELLANWNLATNSEPLYTIEPLR